MLSAAVIWGVAFVAQSAGMEYVGGFTFNCIRSLLGGLVLLPGLLLHRREKQGSFWERNKTLLTGGICCGVVLGIAANLQQQGIRYTSVGKAGFITALYIVLVPFFGLPLGKKVGRFVWAGLLLAVAGLYFLCMDGQFTVGRGDLLMMLCAAVFAVHILVVDHFAPLVNGVALSCVQFFTCSVLSGIPMLWFEQVSVGALRGAAVPLLYAGVMSCGGAYTLQILGQKNMNPTVASMILSLESVVSVLAGQLLLQQSLTGRELLGCGLMFAAVVLAQL